MGDVAAVAGAVTTIISGVDKLVQRQDASDARLEHAVDEVRASLPDPIPAPRSGHRWLTTIPATAAMYVAEVDHVQFLGHDDLRDGFRAKLLDVFDTAIAKGIDGPIGVAVVVYPAGEK